ncbi:hypothetical protein V1294_007448 [Bradyrhizobium sp. AZCC 1678]
MEARRIRLQGERGISRQPIAQGMPACSGCTCMLVCASISILHTRPRVQQAPRIPCSLLRREKVHASLGRRAPRERKRAFSCHHPRKRVTQYSRDSSDRTEKPQRTGYPAFAGYDGRCGALLYPRHCERSEAIHFASQRKNGLLRFARNDGGDCGMGKNGGHGQVAFAHPTAPNYVTTAPAVPPRSPRRR